MKIIMLMQLVFFVLVGTSMAALVNFKIEAARTDGAVKVYLSLPMQTLSEVKV